ncbi:LysE/ArgO family amino acid transporter [Pannonibacter sp. SL95]|uniref:LysE/ArgO family amino acid transporter n=1 Tax=Pannonibacter sp. SL95 TaxID=2995153 RepID=UPI002273A452|nr:LysE/ArgO family amino acid transporter [Pannonibacter sp. SL95]MCY1705454.1 LysE/ArgO family amino acid transporter [Pannonibacter sp. SL95]
MLTAALSGLFLGLSLIIAIGAQNAFVLRQGLRREHVFVVCLTCALSDALLISLGVFALGTVTDLIPGIEPALRYGGAAFLLAYGLRSARSAMTGSSALTSGDGARQGLGATLATALAFTFLNPHVYLDTVLLIGSIASQYPGREAAFGAGAVTGSFLFFFSLGYGARLLAPVFARPNAWRVLDGVIAVVMIGLAIKLIL